MNGSGRRGVAREGETDRTLSTRTEVRSGETVTVEVKERANGTRYHVVFSAAGFVKSWMEL